jgi:serine/threonine protein kinase
VIEAKLGEGGMGFVYRAHDGNLDCDVVIKVPRASMLEDPEFAGRFAREVRSLVRLVHPQIVKVLDVGEHDGLPFAVMQYLSGGSLRDRQRSGPGGEMAPQPPAALRDWLEGVAAALDFIHGQKYIHRDVKPDNILFDGHGHAYLSDFGVAKVLADNRPARHQTVHTGTGMVLGTAQYMAPEMLLGKPYDGRVDQYALAVTVYEFLSGHAPFEAPTPAALFVQQTTQPPPLLSVLVPSVSKEIAAAVQTGLALKPKLRYPDCASFARAVLEGVERAPARSPSARGPAVKLACPHCRKELVLLGVAAGDRSRCMYCGGAFQIPGKSLVQPKAPVPAAPETGRREQVQIETRATEAFNLSPATSASKPEPKAAPLPPKTAPRAAAEAPQRAKAGLNKIVIWSAVGLTLWIGLITGLVIAFRSRPPKETSVAARPEPPVRPAVPEQGEQPMVPQPKEEPVAAPVSRIPRLIVPGAAEGNKLMPEIENPNSRRRRPAGKDDTGAAPVPPSLPPTAADLPPPVVPAPPENPPMPVVVERLPVSDKATRDKIRAKIQDEYQKEYTKSRSEYKLALADKLVQRARTKVDEPSVRFVLLEEAYNLQAQAWDVKAAFGTIDEMADSYGIEHLDVKIDTLNKASSSAVPGPIIETTRVLIDEAIAEDNYDQVKRLVKIAEAAGRNGGTKYREKATEISKEAQDLEKEHKQAEDAAKQMESDPDNANANRVRGKYLALVKGEWDAALPMLARGNDAALKEWAKKDLAQSETANAQAQVEIGHGWRNLADKERDAGRKRAELHLLARAKHWYEQALPSLNDADKKTAQRYLGEVAARLAPEKSSVTLNLPAKRPRASSNKVFLCDLPESDLSCVNPERFRQVEFLTVNGFPAKKGLWLHPPASGFSSVVYRLGRRYTYLKTAVAIGDIRPSFFSASVLTFVVLGDGKTLRSSRPLRKSGENESFSIRVAGVDKLELRVYCPGLNQRAHAIWFDPYLLK